MSTTTTATPTRNGLFGDLISFLKKSALMSLAVVLCALTTIAELLETLKTSKGGTIPRTRPSGDEFHPYVAPEAGDSRSPCPAMNALANHGYLPRNGRGITGQMFVRAVREAYNLSLPHAYFVAYSSLLLLGKTKVDLGQLAAHNHIEHDASLIHANANGHPFAPTSNDPTLVQKLLEEVEVAGGLGVDEIAFARVRRERSVGEGTQIDFLHRQIALGEASIALLIFMDETGKMPLDTVRSWLIGGRLPEGWVPTRSGRFIDTAKIAKRVTDKMNQIIAGAR